MRPNLHLTLACQRRITGANVHTVHTALHCYHGFIEMSQEHPEMVERAAEYEGRLSAFAISGNVYFLQESVVA